MTVFYYQKMLMCFMHTATEPQVIIVEKISQVYMYL